MNSKHRRSKLFFARKCKSMSNEGHGCAKEFTIYHIKIRLMHLQVVLDYYGATNQFVAYDNVDWPGPKVPVNEPECGYEDEYCSTTFNSKSKMSASRPFPFLNALGNLRFSLLVYARVQILCQPKHCGVQVSTSFCFVFRNTRKVCMELIKILGNKFSSTAKLL